jgi:hypothetical protein
MSKSELSAASGAEVALRPLGHCGERVETVLPTLDELEAIIADARWGGPDLELSFARLPTRSPNVSSGRTLSFLHEVVERVANIGGVPL